MLSSVQHLHEDIYGLVWITAGLECDGTVLYQLPDPMPLHFDMLGLLMELGVLCQCN